MMMGQEGDGCIPEETFKLCSSKAQSQWALIIMQPSLLRNLVITVPIY